MGLKTAGEPDRHLEEAVQALLSKGSVLTTLYRSGFLKTSSSAYARGVAYLLKTQFPDGSWYVRSRAPKLQPYFQSSFPFDHDQWISCTATGLAVMALAPAVN